MNEAQRELIAGRLALLKERMPEFLPFVRDLYALGMIEGWRAIVRIELKENH